MKILQGFLGFIPFIVFSVLTIPLGVQLAAWLSVLAAALIILATARHGIQIVPAAQGAILLPIAVLAITGGPGVDTVLAKYGAGLASLVLGLFLLATAASMPFTAQVSRSSVPREVWHTPQFLMINRRISTAWGTATLVMGMSHLAAAEMGTHAGELVLRLVVTWAAPIVACWVANAYTQRVVKEARQMEARFQQMHEAQTA